MESFQLTYEWAGSVLADAILDLPRMYIGNSIMY
jgi:hypothetical protein